MTQLLVSVRNLAEARAAVAGGAHLIDLKEPLHGPLGAVTRRTANEVGRFLAERLPLSVACGELLDLPADPHVGHAAPWLAEGVAWAKLGLAGCAATGDWPSRWQRWRAALPTGVEPVAVAYADASAARAPSPDQVFALAVAQRCRAVLVDTFDKARGTLDTWWTTDELQRWVARLRQARMTAVVAGSVTAEMLDGVLAARPSVVAVRGAACRGGRGGQVETARVAQLARRLKQYNEQPSAFLPA